MHRPDREDPGVARLARDLRMPAAALEDFSAGRGPLNDAVLCTLTLQLFGGHTVFLPELDKLGPANTQEPTPLGHGPPPLDPATLPRYTAGPAQHPAKVPAPPPKRPRWGWID